MQSTESTESRPTGNGKSRQRGNGATDPRTTRALEVRDGLGDALMNLGAQRADYRCARFIWVSLRGRGGVHRRYDSDPPALEIYERYHQAHRQLRAAVTEVGRAGRAVLDFIFELGVKGRGEFSSYEEELTTCAQAVTELAAETMFGLPVDEDIITLAGRAAILLALVEDGCPSEAKSKNWGDDAAPAYDEDSDDSD
jgi:hypothetical protein